MNFKLKTWLVLSGAALLAVPALQAQRAGNGARGGSGARPAAFASGGLARGNGGRFTNARPARAGGYGHGGYSRGGGHHHYGRYYYLGGIPYFYPFYGYGFGYPYGYDGFYGSAFADGPYEGRIAGGRDREGDNDNDHDRGREMNSSSSDKGPSLPSAVQRQLVKRGYYKGSVDGQFGPASREALSRFQKSQDLKGTGKIDEETLDALGFTDQR